MGGNARPSPRRDSCLVVAVGGDACPGLVLLYVVRVRQCIGDSRPLNGCRAHFDVPQVLLGKRELRLGLVGGSARPIPWKLMFHGGGGRRR